MSEASTPSERTVGPLARYLDLRDSLRAKRGGDGGRDTCVLLTVAMDQAVGTLVSPCPDDVAVVAIGGYGRSELSLYSDVDLMILHEKDDASEIAAALFRPLWDAKLKLGHAVRTLRDVSVAAKEGFETHTTLLTARLVTGDETLFSRMMEEVAAVTRARPLRRHLMAAERERRIRTPYLMMATDVKNGRGGLRTIQGFEWERRREELIGRFSADLGPDQAVAGEALLRVRNALHAVSGRAYDVFAPDLREPVARWLGTDTFDTARVLLDAVEVIDHLATQRWPEVIGEKPGRVWSRLSRKPTLPGTAATPSIEELVTILQAGDRGQVVFEKVWARGHLDEVLPEWDVVRSLPQLAPFHEHPVSAHLWRTVDEMLALITETEYQPIAQELDAHTVLVLAAFLHDIGKGHGGEHAATGSEIAAEFCRRMSVDPGTTSLIVGAVRHHLLLPLTATRRDLDDPSVIADVAAMIGNLRLLQVVYLLTVADSRATGPTMWSEWKATLVRSLFVRCAALLGARAPLEPGTTAEEVVAAAGPGLAAEARAHVERMPPDYLRSTTSEDFVWHLDLISGIEGVSNVGVRSGSPADTAIVVGWDRPEFRRRVAEAFAANGIDVLEARMLNRSDGLVVDSFRVRDDRTETSVRPDKWGSVRADIEAGLTGELDTLSKVTSRAAAYGPEGGEPPIVSASVDAATGDLVLTIKCADRIGRLAEILTVLDERGFGIRLAQIDSRLGEVIDTFHVSSIEAGDEDIAVLQREIAAALSP